MRRTKWTHPGSDDQISQLKKSHLNGLPLFHSVFQLILQVDLEILPFSSTAYSSLVAAPSVSFDEI
jgi:hypothetical protein